ncbi:uncharacterized protein PHA67_023285 [Liasis olivaceus]
MAGRDRGATAEPCAALRLPTRAAALGICGWAERRQALAGAERARPAAESGKPGRFYELGKLPTEKATCLPSARPRLLPAPPLRVRKLALRRRVGFARRPARARPATCPAPPPPTTPGSHVWRGGGGGSGSGRLLASPAQGAALGGSPAAGLQASDQAWLFRSLPSRSLSPSVPLPKPRRAGRRSRLFAAAVSAAQSWQLCSPTPVRLREPRRGRRSCYLPEAEREAALGCSWAWSRVD